MNLEMDLDVQLDPNIST